MSNNNPFIEDVLNSEDKDKHDKRTAIMFRGIANRLSLCMGSEGFKAAQNPFDKLGVYRLLPSQLIETMFIRISLASMFRRYRQIQLLTLQEAIALVLDSRTHEEAYERLVKRAKELGQAHKESVRVKAEQAQRQRIGAVQAAASAEMAARAAVAASQTEEELAERFNAFMYGASD